MRLQRRCAQQVKGLGEWAVKGKCVDFLTGHKRKGPTGLALEGDR
jgi:hypothetical protein